ncbi:amidohydrolase family protein [Quadrisphaera oryzae]|uniref:amidohydrolase family protein n=1 Tax=Quadrisphaera TaxID=317661 RepID=UPI0016464713|nr:amidohydrolase family protein [Quadrisphaera sp. RL12-1S]MBC3761462.1 amidohydrolase [Quadrisphaera sp. RL12-1S]
MTHHPRAALVDVHAHFLTDRYVRQAKAAGIKHPDGMPTWPSWDAGEHLALMDRTGIATAVLSTSSPGVHFGDPAAAADLARHMNDTASQLTLDHPGRFRFFSTLPLPDVEASLTELERSAALPGWEAVALMTSAGGHYLHEPLFQPLLTALDEREAVVLLHPTSPERTPGLDMPRPLMEFLFESARAVVGLTMSGTLLRHAKVKMVVTHSGGVLPLLADRADLIKQSSPDLSGAPSVRAQLARLWYDLAGTPEPAALPALLGLVQTDRLLYGSDYCFTPDSAVQVQQASLDAAEHEEAVGWRTATASNAAHLLGAGRVRPTP